MTPFPILVSIDSNEAGRPRATKLRTAIDDDRRFEEIPAVEPMPFDLEFWQKGNAENAIHVEIKDFSEDGNSDYLSSILNGHLWEQVLAAREIGEPMVIVVLGDDNDVGAAIRKAASHEMGGKRVNPEKLMEYYRMIEGFEANAISLGIQVWRLKTDPWKRMLLRIRKILEGGNLDGFIPKPAEGVRMAVGLSIIAGRGVGPKKARNILARYNLCLKSKDGFTGILEDCEGIGPKLAEQIRKNVEVIG